MKFKDLPSKEDLLSKFSYCKDTGNLTSDGVLCGWINDSGYREVRFRSVSYKAHRVVWKIVYGEDPESEIDHVNHIKTDNRICNLRLATRVQNCCNRPAGTNNTSGKKGVSFDKAKGRWRAQIYMYGKVKYLGLYDTKEGAHQAYSVALINKAGDFAAI